MATHSSHRAGAGAAVQTAAAIRYTNFCCCDVFGRECFSLLDAKAAGVVRPLRDF